MADNNGPGQQAEDNVGTESQEDSELCEDMPTAHFRSIVMNVLLLFIPVGLITGALGAPAAAVFIFNFLPLIQLAAVITLAMQELVARSGVVLSGLLRILVNNPVELIVRGFCSV